MLWSSLLLQDLHRCVEMVDKMMMNADTSNTAVVMKAGTCSFEDRSTDETSTELILNGDETESIGMTVSCLHVESTSETLSCCCSRNERIAGMLEVDMTSSTH